MRKCATGSGFPAAIALGAALLLLATTTLAAGTPIPHGTLELLAENQSIAPGHEFYLGLHFQLEKGWHIYWINPGDSGEPPRVKWQLPAGVITAEMQWPAPQRLGTSTIVDFGYQDTVMLIAPMHASTNLAAKPPAQLGAEVKLLICREVCIPGKAQLSLTLPVKSQSPAPDPRTGDLFAATRKSLPQPALANWSFRVNDAKDSFVLTGNLGHPVTQAIFFPFAESQIDNATPQKLLPDATGFRLTLRKSNQLLKPIDRLQGVLVLSADRAYAINVPVGKPGAAKNGSGTGIPSQKFLKEVSPK